MTTRPAAAPAVVLLAHGSPDERHARDITALVQGVRRACGWPSVAAYLDHHGPEPSHAVALLGPARRTGPVVLVPALLSRAHHVRVDVPAATRAIEESAGVQVVVAEALGPHPLLGAGLGEIVHAAEPGAGAVLVYLAGSSDHAAVDALVAQVRAGLPSGLVAAFATLDDYLPLDRALESLPREGEVVAVSAMLAEGVLRDRMALRCAERGIPLLEGVLARTDALTALVAARVRAALAA